MGIAENRVKNGIRGANVRQKTFVVPKAPDVRNFRDFATQLEAALAMIAADPCSKWIRHLRACSRHVEAQIALLIITDPRSSRATSFEKIGHLIKQLNKASGRVREIDAQLDLLRTLQSSVVQPNDGRDSGQPRELALAHLRKRERHSVRKYLRRHRVKEVRAFQSNLSAVQKPLVKGVERLLDQFDEDIPVNLTDALLYRTICSWFRDRLRLGDNGPQSDSKLHAIRKAAKTARYMAETSSAPRLQALAAVFKEIQHSGGTWHDILQLHKNAVRETGRQSALSEDLRKLRKSSTVGYKTLLQEFESKKGHVLPRVEVSTEGVSERRNSEQKSTEF